MSIRTRGSTTSARYVTGLERRARSFRHRQCSCIGAARTRRQPWERSRNERGLLDAEPAALIKIDGSSTVFPITEAVAEEFQRANRGAVRVTVGISGTGGGFKKFCRGDTDIQDASRPISAEEIEACRKTGVQYLELPIAFDALTIAVSQQNTWADSIT